MMIWDMKVGLSWAKRTDSVAISVVLTSALSVRVVLWWLKELTVVWRDLSSLSSPLFLLFNRLDSVLEQSA